MFYCSILRWLFCPTIFRRKLIKPKMKIKCQHFSHCTLVLVCIHPKSVKEEALKTRLFYDNRSKWGGGKLETNFFSMKQLRHKGLIAKVKLSKDKLLVFLKLEIKHFIFKIFQCKLEKLFFTDNLS